MCTVRGLLDVLLYFIIQYMHVSKYMIFTVINRNVQIMFYFL